MDDLTKIRTGLNSGIDEEVKKAFDLLYRKSKPIVLKIAMKYLKTPALAKDVVQDVFTALWTNRQKLVGVLDILAFLAEVAKHKCLTALKMKARENRRLNEYLQLQENYSVPRYLLPTAVLENERKLDIALKDFDSFKLLLLDLKYQKDLGYKEIGTRIGKRANTVAKEVQRIRDEVYIIISKMA